MADEAIISYAANFDDIPSVDSKALVVAQSKPLAIVPSKHLATVPNRYEQVFSVQAQTALPARLARLLLEDGDKGKQVAIPRGTQLPPTRGNNRLLSTKVNRNGMLVCAKYTTAHPIINGVRAYPSQVRYTDFIPPLPKRQRASPESALEQGPR